MDESTSSRLDACAARSARLHPGLRFLFEGRTPALLAPMAGVNDIVFRRLCLEQGCDLTYTEMISSKALSFANEKTRHLLDLAEGERRVAIQLFGHEPEVMAREAAWVEDELGDALALIDINMGCPAHKIVKKGDGSALMRDQDLAASIVRDVARAVSCPVTVKFRRGFGAEEETAVDFGLRMEDAGAAAVTVHGRTAAQMYRGPSEWECVARVKAALSVPVIGNGDIVSGASAADMVRATGCDGVMIARGAQGNPWIFADVRRVLDGMPPAPDPTTTISNSSSQLAGGSTGSIGAAAASNAARASAA